MTARAERPTQVRAAVLFLTAAGLLIGLAAADARRRPAPVLRWTAPRQVDRGTTTIALARDERSSRLPGSRSWRRFPIDARAPLDAVSCSSPTFCAAVDTDGDVVTSTDPAAGPAAWTISQIRPEFPSPAAWCR